MPEEYAYKNSTGEWTPGFASREEAAQAAVAASVSPVWTAHLIDECPSYFARFEASNVIARMISGLENGERDGKLIGGYPARAFLQPILSAGPGDNFLGDGDETPWKLQVDLMNRLEATAAAWVKENGLRFELPKFVTYGSEQVHVAGAHIGIPLL